jgi:phosphatidylserine/phosphatidylglycerophosphate/cardiolipin synthase-like enzyme
LIDHTVPHAHNKVLVVDRRDVITGSLNFTSAAPRNAENVLLIKDDPSLATEYATNWSQRERESQSIGDFRISHRIDGPPSSQACSTKLVRTRPRALTPA